MTTFEVVCLVIAIIALLFMLINGWRSERFWDGFFAGLTIEWIFEALD